MNIKWFEKKYNKDTIKDKGSAIIPAETQP